MVNKNSVAHPFRFALSCWPLITGATIGLCGLTKVVGSLLGIDLPDQADLEVVRKCLGWNLKFVIICAEVLLLMPAIEEFVFRWFLFSFPCRDRVDNKWLAMAWAAVSAGLFTAAHYYARPWPDTAFLALIFFGLAQCWLYRKTKCIGCVILNHALFNLLNLVLIFIVPA